MCVCARAQLCLILCNPVACSPPGSPVLATFQAKILKSVAVSFSMESFRPGVEPVSPVSSALQADS